jgi:hypothetical protein
MDGKTGWCNHIIARKGCLVNWHFHNLATRHQMPGIYRPLILAVLRFFHNRMTVKFESVVLPENSGI